jgi:hypothetical protein
MRAHLAVVAVFVVLLSSCGGDAGGVVTPPPKSQLRIVAGQGTSDTIQTALVQPLVIEVDVGGAAAVGMGVRIDALSANDPTRLGESTILLAGSRGGQLAPSILTTTDASGRVSVWPVFGTIAGITRVVVTAPTLNLTDTATFTVMPGVAVAINLAVRDTAMSPNGQYAIGAFGFDRFKNHRAPTYSLLKGGGTVDATGVVKEGTSAGRVAVLIRDGTKVDTAFSTIVPDELFLIHQSGSLFRARLDLSQRTDVANPFGGSPELSPDGHTLALIIQGVDPLRGIDYGLYIGDSRAPAIAARRIVPRTAVQFVLGHQFSPDGQWIYFSGSTPPKNSSIWRVKPDGSQLEQVTSNPAVNQQHVAISPDGTRIAWDEPANITILNPATGATTIVSPGGSFPTFSPDGKRVAYVNSILNIVNVDGTGLQAYQPSFFGFGMFVAWSADGQWLLSSDSSFTLMVNVNSHEAVPVPHLQFVSEVQRP